MADRYDAPRAYYNEIDGYCCDWLSNLMDAQLITPGKIDNRSIADVRPEDVAGFQRVHFFAGIAGWDLALNLAGWGERECWTGSCPCQPFSGAGKGGGLDDQRHLWPEFFRLIRECRPPVIFGEQVASALTVGRASPYVPEVWDREAVLSVLRQLEGHPPARLHRVREVGRAFAEAVQFEEDGRCIPDVAGVEPRPCTSECGASSSEGAGSSIRIDVGGYPGANRHGALRDDGHPIRLDETAGLERAFAGSDRARGRLHESQRASGALCPQRDGEYVGASANCRDCEGDFGETPGEIERLLESLGGASKGPLEWAWIDAIRSDLDRADYTLGIVVAPAASVGAPHIRQRIGFVADSTVRGWGEEYSHAAGGAFGNCSERLSAGSGAGRGDSRPGPTNGFWRDPDWLLCRDGKWRPVESGTFPLAHGIPGRVGRLRAYGNAINPHQFAVFIGAYLDTGSAQIPSHETGGGDA